MTLQEMQAIRRRAELAYGLTPGILDALVMQESGGSSDLGKLGQMTRHGRAKGPFQILEKFHGKLPDDYAGQAMLAAKILAEGGRTPEQQLASYYGTGNAPPGHPTTAQYVSQVLGRMRPDVRMASTDMGPGSTDTSRWPTGDPRTGMMDMPMSGAGLLPPLPELPEAQAPRQGGLMSIDPQTGLAPIQAMGLGLMFPQLAPMASSMFAQSNQRAPSEYDVWRAKMEQWKAQVDAMKTAQEMAYTDLKNQQALQGQVVGGQQIGSVPSGYVRIPDADSPIGFRDEPIPGSKEFEVRRQKAESLKSGVDDIQRMIDLVEKHGSEVYGPVSGTMASLYGQILSHVAAARNLGVLQAGELENLQSQLVDPSKLRSLGVSNETIVAGYKELLRTLRAKLKAESGKQETSEQDLKTTSGLTAEEQKELAELRKLQGGF